MKSDFYAEISKNKRKTVLLFIVFGLFVMLLAFVLGEILGSSYLVMGISFFVMIIWMLVSYYSGDKTLLSLSKAKEVTKKEDPFYYNTVEGLSLAAGIPMPKIYMINETSINAFATGRSPDHAAVTVTSGCRKRLNRQEFEGVVAHEIAHIQNYDIRVMMLSAVMVGVIVLLSDFLLRSFLFGGGRRRESGNAGLILILVGLVLAILAPIIAQMIKLAVSRKREYLADATGAKLTRYPPGLASALKKIKNDHDKVVDTANKATAHLYIENPLRNTKTMFSSLFSTHPPVDERIKRLEAM